MDKLLLLYYYIFFKKNQGVYGIVSLKFPDIFTLFFVFFNQLSASIIFVKKCFFAFQKIFPIGHLNRLKRSHSIDLGFLSFLFCFL